MDKKMSDRAQVVKQIEDSLLGKRGIRDQEVNMRLGKTVAVLLSFWSAKRVVRWMLEENDGLRGNAPLDLVYSNYATEDLLRVIAEIKRKYKSRKAGKARLRRLLKEPSVLEGGKKQVPLRGKIRPASPDPGSPPKSDWDIRAHRRPLE